MAAEANFFRTSRKHFVLHGPDVDWRSPQLGALGALLAHWSVSRRAGTLSIPTGSGKTAVALAAPFLLPEAPGRVLIVVPSQALRSQLAAAAEDLEGLRGSKAWRGPAGPKVRALTGMVADWSDLRAADVVVGLPHVLNPDRYPDNPPPPDLFDLIVIDEAHHAPAPTWSAILDHFHGVPAVLLTATPIRRDGRRLPGELLFHFPVRRAIEEKIFAPVLPDLVSVEGCPDRDSVDRRVARRVVQLAQLPEHATSAVMIRASTKVRLARLITIYAEEGLEVTPLHGGLTPAEQRRVREGLTEGSIRSVGVVDMLGEGFDLPALRLLGYHDKHKSLPATTQMIGRLARVSDAHPQPSYLITPADADVYPHLKGAVRALYEEDPDWASVLPGLIDAELEEQALDRTFIEAFDASFGPVSPDRLHPMLRARVVEVFAPGHRPSFANGQVPAELMEGQQVAGGVVLYVGIDSKERLLVVVIGRQPTPKWSRDPGLVGIEYELGIATFRAPVRTGEPLLGFVNAQSVELEKVLLDLIAAPDLRATVDPDRMGRYLDGLDRASVSAVGMRNTNAANRGTTAYRTNMGGGVDRALRTIETSRTALGHVNLQVFEGNSTTTGGAALEKGKIWVTRHVSLRRYDEWVDDLAARLGNATVGRSGPLLPSLSRGSRLSAWPSAPAVAAELDPRMYARDWAVIVGEHRVPVEALELEVIDDGAAATRAASGGAIVVVATAPLEGMGERQAVWRGQLHLDGLVEGEPAPVSKGLSGRDDLRDLLLHFPPTIYFLDGTTTVGATQYPRATRVADVPYDRFLTHDWPGVDVTAESDRNAEAKGRGRSILAELALWLEKRPPRGLKRWLLLNDGPDEIADILVVEPLPSGEVALQLWHAKASAGDAASSRVRDAQVVAAQAIRSRRWLTGTRLWPELERRLTGQASPPATSLPGSEPLSELVSEISRDKGWGTVPPLLRATVGIAQPGFSRAHVLAEIDTEGSGVVHLLTVLQDLGAADGFEFLVLGRD